MDEQGNPQQIVITETPRYRITTLCGHTGEAVLSFRFDKSTNTLYNVENGVSLQFPPANTSFLQPCAVYASSGKDYEYEFCKAGETMSEHERALTIRHIFQMVGMVADTVSIMTFLRSLPTITAIQFMNDQLKSSLQDLATAIADKILGGLLDLHVYIDVNYKCVEMYENDPFYPTGGFWFLGYYPMNISWSIAR